MHSIFQGWEDMTPLEGYLSKPEEPGGVLFHFITINSMIIIATLLHVESADTLTSAVHARS